MNIVLCIKQVPDTSDIKWTENNTISREGVESIMNPLDEYIIELALRIKSKIEDTKITAISMGPMQADKVLKRAISLGCDRGILLCDKKFAGADTFATSQTLASAIRSKLSEFDLVMCGQFASDGDTAQTGPSLARKLNIPQVTYVKDILDIDLKILKVLKEVEDKFEKLEVKLPALLCINKPYIELRRPLIDGFIKAQNTKIEVYNAQDISVDIDKVGLKGSPTYVSKAFRPEIKHEGSIIVYEGKKSIETFAEKLREYGVKNV